MSLLVFFPMYVCNSYHDLLMMTIILDDIAIWNVNYVNSCCIIREISKKGVINLLKNAALHEKVGTL